jgi:acyl-CoA synthetase (AMP-forming)/AMP-acid ligase II
MNICDPISQQAITLPEIPAIIDGERTVSYRDLDRLVRKTAAHLIDRGVAPSDVVGLCLKDHADHLIALLAVARMGAVVLSMDWRAKDRELANLAAVFGPALVLIEPGARELSNTANVPHDEDWRCQVGRADPEREFPRNGEMPLVINLTSGTTGTPKGIVVTHSQCLHRLTNKGFRDDQSESHRYLSVLPICYSSSRNNSLSHLTGGNTVILYSPLFTPEEYVQAVSKHRVSFAYLVPTVLRRLLALPEQDGLLLPGLRILVTAAAAIYPEEKREVVRRISPNLYESYGTAGTGSISILRPEEIAVKAESVGRLNPMSEVEIVDAEDRPLPNGTVGRIRCRGPGVAAGFYNNGGDPLDDATFRDGWCYPEDLAMMDDDGYLYLKGRASDLIIRGGVNIYPDEIEQVLLAHPDIAEAAVVGSPSREFGEEVTAFVVPRGDIAVREAMAHCRARLTAHKVPRRIIPVEALPKTAAGKVRKRELAARLMDQ